MFYRFKIAEKKCEGSLLPDLKVGVTYTVIYDTKSGLILAGSHEYPSEKIYMTLQSTNANV
jgi:hypothetical protein